MSILIKFLGSYLSIGCKSLNLNPMGHAEIENKPLHVDMSNLRVRVHREVDFCAYLEPVEKISQMILAKSKMLKRKFSR